MRADVDGVMKPVLVDRFRTNTKFSDAVEFYVFDKKMRLIALDALERIEIGLRADIAVFFGKKGSLAHRDKSLLDGSFTTQFMSESDIIKIINLHNNGMSEADIASSMSLKKKKVSYVLNYTEEARSIGHDDWLSRIDDKLRSSKEDFAKHFKTNYPLDVLPIWMAVELWDFGTISRFFSGMKTKDRDFIANKYRISDGKTLEAWIRHLNDVRNICAHHSRLWNRSMQMIVPKIKSESIPDMAHITERNRFYASASIMNFMLKTINPSSSWQDRFIEHVKSLKENSCVTLNSAGFPDDWDKHNLWIRS